MENIGEHVKLSESLGTGKDKIPKAIQEILQDIQGLNTIEGNLLYLFPLVRSHQLVFVLLRNRKKRTCANTSQVVHW